jgi:hypothetical protein
MDFIKNPDEYPKAADEAWFKKVIASAKFIFLYQVKEGDSKAPKLTIEQLNALSNSALDKMVRGFLTEFLRQSRENMEDMNIAFSMSTPNNVKWAREEGKAGTYHTLACAKRFRDIGLDKNNTMKALHTVIQATVQSFSNHHAALGTDEKPFVPSASILKDYSTLNPRLDELFPSSPDSKRQLE